MRTSDEEEEAVSLHACISSSFDGAVVLQRKPRAMYACVYRVTPAMPLR